MGGGYLGMKSRAATAGSRRQRFVGAKAMLGESLASADTYSEQTLTEITEPGATLSDFLASQQGQRALMVWGGGSAGCVRACVRA